MKCGCPCRAWEREPLGHFQKTSVDPPFHSHQVASAALVKHSAAMERPGTALSRASCHSQYLSLPLALRVHS